MALPHEWDVFISYSSMDRERAMELYQELNKCVTAMGARPRVFLDQTRDDGIPPGADWRDELEEALTHSRHVVALFTPQYFKSGMCTWELRMAVGFHAEQRSRVFPILYEETAKDLIPIDVVRINWVRITQPNWFVALRDSLGLQESRNRRTLRFETGIIPNMFVSHTLPPLQVAITDEAGDIVTTASDPITLSTAPPGIALSGTLTVTAEHGVAIFTDLSFQSAAADIRLAAAAPGCDRLLSAPFEIRPQTRRGTEGASRVPSTGRPRFFPDGRTLAVLGTGQMSVWASDQEPCGMASLTAPIRLWACGERCLAVADWQGRLLLAQPDGQIWATDLADGRRDVPGALAFTDEDRLIVGMWSGAVWSVELGGTGITRLLDHPAGVQALVASGDRILLGGLDGTLTVYEHGTRVAEHPLEPLLLGIGLSARIALVAGEHKVYQLRLDGGSAPVPVRLTAAPTISALLDPNPAVILDATGQGMCFDSQLAMLASFHVAPGARLVSASADGRLLVLDYPDGQHVLMRDGRVCHTNPGPMAISSDGRLAAREYGAEIEIVPPDGLTSEAQA